MDGKEQQLASEEVPDPGDWSVALGHGSTSATWDTLVERHSARQPIHLLLVINPILCNVHRPITSTTSIIIIIIIHEFHDDVSLKQNFRALTYAPEIGVDCLRDPKAVNDVRSRHEKSAPESGVEFKATVSEAWALRLMPFRHKWTFGKMKVMQVWFVCRWQVKPFDSLVTHGPYLSALEINGL